jgi:hypothetical protein
MQLSCHITTLVHAEIILSTGNSRACYLFSPYKKLKCKLYEIMEQRKGPGLNRLRKKSFCWYFFSTGICII